MTACKSDSSDCDSRRGICDSTAAYVALCRAKGVWINQTAECETCGDVDRERALNEAWIEDSKLTADVIVVVSESEKLTVSGRPEDQLKNLINNIDKKLQAEGIIDNRYSLIGFGGQNVHADHHQHTTRGKIWNEEKHFYKGARALEFGGRVGTDAYEAIKLASELEFRPQASRLIFLVTEDERSAVNTTLTIEELQKLLEENGIVLNVVSEYAALQKNTIRIVGISHDGYLISGKDKDRKYKLLDRVGEDYAKLSSATRGSLFRLDMLMSKNDDLMRKVPEVAARQVRYDVNKTYRSCQCVRNVDGRAISKCKSIRT